MKKRLFWLASCSLSIMLSCNNETAGKTDAADSTTVATDKPFSAKEEEVTYNDGSTTLKSFVVYDQSHEGKRGAVLVIPEWWGLNDYVKNRARQLAQLGYIAIAVDMYGNGKIADNLDSAKAFSTPFYTNLSLAQSRFDAAVAKVKSYAQTDTSRIAAIGYCFGGAQVLNMARLGEDLKGVVSFHGNLIGAPAKKELLKSEILVCHGAADPFVPETEVAAFKKQMDSIGAKYTFKAYEGAVHAFSNPEATEKGKNFGIPISYNAAADTASWKEMESFLGRVLK